jgi:hypothetical protein
MASSLGVRAVEQRGELDGVAAELIDDFPAVVEHQISLVVRASVLARRGRDHGFRMQNP